MRAITVTALLGFVHAQQNCASKSDCNTPNDYCCARWTIVSVPSEATWGQFSNIWGEKGTVAGNSFTSCTNEAYINKHKEDIKDSKDGSTNNYADLQNFLDYHEGVRPNLGLEEGDNVDEWITKWQGDADTQKNFMITVACEDEAGAEEDMEEESEMPMSIGLMVTLAIVLSIVLLCVACCICNCVIVSQKRNKWNSAAKLVETPLGTIEYSMKGNAPWILGLHGTPGFHDGTVGDFDGWLEAGFGVIAPSRPNYGRTKLKSGSNTYDQ